MGLMLKAKDDGPEDIRRQRWHVLGGNYRYTETISSQDSSFQMDLMIVDLA